MDVLEGLQGRASRMSADARALADAVERLAPGEAFPPELLKKEIVSTLRSQGCLWDAISSLGEIMDLVRKGEPLPPLLH
jgi:hypothetical protein